MAYDVAAETARRKAEQEARIVQLRQAGQAIADKLGATIAPQDDDTNPHYLRMTDRDGRQFGMWWPLNSDKAEVGARYPHDALSSTPRPSVRIGVNPARPADRIAADVARRFYPAFVEEWDAWAERERSWQEHAAAGAALAERVAGALGVAATHDDRGGRSSVRYYRSGSAYGTWETSGSGTATIELHSVPADLAVRIAELVKAAQ